MTSAKSDSTSAPDGFGPNEWMVDEIYQQYLADRHSVDPAWWDFFADYKPNERAAAAAAGARDAASAAATPPAATNGQVKTAQPPTEKGKPSESTAKPPAPAKSESAGKVTKSGPVAQAPLGSGETAVALRGPAARVAVNMEASLEIPTATSVRAVPGKTAHRQPDRHQ